MWACEISQTHIILQTISSPLSFTSTSPFATLISSFKFLVSSSTSAGGEGGGNGPSTSAGASNAGHGSQAPNALAGLPTIQRYIIEFISSQPDTVLGVHVAAIARGIASMPGGTGDAVEISDALDKLMDGGYVYTCIDENHFKVAN